MRRAAYAGLFYPKTAGELTRLLEACFIHKLGPGALPGKQRPRALPVKAVICPHAGYAYSGMAAAWSYKALAEAELPDLFILIGPNHRSNESGISIQTFETPLGFVRTDQDFAKALVRKGGFRVNNSIHADEHSLEVQLPFLQFSLGSRAEKIRILALLVSDDLDLDRAAEDLKETISELRRKACFIVSSDFTHYGPSYGYIPFSNNIRSNLSALDKQAFSFILKGDALGFRDYVRRTGASVCGYLSIILLLKTISFRKASLEQYYTSGDVVGDYTNSVSYASIVFM